MSIKEITIDLDAPLSSWPVFYKDGLPFIYDDEPLFYNEEGERLGQHPRHSDLAIYLREVLREVFANLNCAITFDLTFRDSLELIENAAADGGSPKRRYVDITPDVSIIKGADIPDRATYYVDRDGPPPNVVIEVGSPSTYTEDLGRKLRVYSEIVQANEYIAYDPQQRRLWKGSRLKAWALVGQKYEEIRPDFRGWIWSKELQSWLCEDGQFLRLRDPEGNIRPTPAEKAAILAEQEYIRAEQEYTRAEQERSRAEQASVRAEQASVRAEQERSRAEQAENQLQQERNQAGQERLRAEQAEQARLHAEQQSAQEYSRAEQERNRAEQAEQQLEQERARFAQLMARLKEVDPDAKL